MENLTRFRGLVRQLLAEGVAPTCTEFAKRGWGYVYYPGHYASTQPGKTPNPVPGSGVSFISGRYTVARREELLAAGWRFMPYPSHRALDADLSGAGRWVPPTR